MDDSALNLHYSPKFLIVGRMTVRLCCKLAKHKVR